MKIDAIFEHIGNFGRYHQILYVVVFMAGIPNALILMHFVYSHYEPNFHCKFPQELLNYTENTTIAYDDILNYTIPMEIDNDGLVKRSQCHMYDRNYNAFEESFLEDPKNTTLIGCKYGYVFDLEEGQNTAVVEYSLVCDRAWLAPFVVSLVQAGMGVGSFSGTLADRFGRRTIFLWASALQVVFTVFASMSWNYYSYAAAMFLAGCAQLVNYVVAFVLAAEVIAVRWRNFISISSFFSFAVGYCIEPGLGYALPNWRHFLWAVSGLSALFYLPSFWLFPESARWLLIKGRSEEGIKELKKMAKWNKVDLDVEAFVKENLLEEEIEAEKRTSTIKETFTVLFRSKITARCLTAFLLWTVTGLAYFAISLYSTSFSENRHLHLLFGGLSEFPALVLGYYAVRLIGRPRSAFWLMCCCGISSIILPFMIAPEISVLRTITAMIGKGAISAVFYVAYFLTTEVSPTLQRSSAMSIGSFCARVGGFSAPFLAFAGKEYRFVPNLTMGSAAIVAGIMCLFFVPETKGVQLPDTTEEAEHNNRIYGFRLFRSLAFHASSESTPRKEKTTTKI